MTVSGQGEIGSARSAMLNSAEGAVQCGLDDDPSAQRADIGTSSSQRTSLLALLAALTLATPVLADPAVDPGHDSCRVLAQVRGVRAQLFEAMAGERPAFVRLDELLPRLRSAEESFQRLSALDQGARILRAADGFRARQLAVVQTQNALASIRAQSQSVLIAVEEISSHELILGSPVARIAAAGQLVMLSQRIPKNAAEFLGPDGVNPEAVFLLGQDRKAFLEIATALLNGSKDLGMLAPRNASQKDRAKAALKAFAGTDQLIQDLLAQLRDFVAAKEFQRYLVRDIDELDRLLQPLC